MLAQSEPKSFVAGDTVEWQRSFSAYRANEGWSLAYVFVTSNRSKTVNAAADGANFKVTLTATDSADFAPATWSWQAVVTKGAERHTIGAGSLQVCTDFSKEGDGFDTRSQAERILQCLKDAYESYSSSRGLISEYEIAGRRIKFRDGADILTHIKHWEIEVTRETQAKKLAAGSSDGGRILVRM